MGMETTGSLSKWANAAQGISSDNLKKLAQATGLSLDWLMLDRGEMFSSSESEAVKKLDLVRKIVAPTSTGVAGHDGQPGTDVDHADEAVGKARSLGKGRNDDGKTEDAG